MQASHADRDYHGCMTEFADTAAHTQDYLHFLNDSPSSFHAAQLVAQRLIDAGFARQDESEAWDGSAGGHVVIRDGAVIAYFVPENVSTNTGFSIVGAHTDSPWLTLKPQIQSAGPDGWSHINVETYGGGLWNSWLDRELAVAGRVITADGDEVLVRTGSLARIPQLAIHLDRNVNSEGLKLSSQQHIHPVWNVGSDADLMERIALDAGVESAVSIVAFDLNLIPAQGAGLFGHNNVFIAAGRQDNLSSVHAGLTAFERLMADSGTSTGDNGGVSESGNILVFACFDHEEIGSGTRTGACGPFLEDVLRRTATALGRDSEGTARMFAASTCISADAAHSVHPNYSERHDPAHHPVMGRGPVLKVNANQRYATDAPGIALWNAACEKAGVPTQTFVGNNDMPCGSTIGPLSATRLGIRTVDVGVPLLSMHSAREMSHVWDLRALSAALEAYWRS